MCLYLLRMMLIQKLHQENVEDARNAAFNFENKESGMPYKFSRSCLETVMSMLRGLRKKENSSVYVSAVLFYF